MTESLPTTTADILILNIVATEMAECMKTSTIGHDRGSDTEEADHHANDIHLRMVNHKQGHLHAQLARLLILPLGRSEQVVT